MKPGLITLLMLMFGVVGSAQADVPKWVNVQGRLTNASGVALSNGNYGAVVKIYDAVSGGTVLWDGGSVTLATDQNGYFNFVLGKDTSNTNLSVNANQALYLGIQINPDPEMTPRLTLNGSFYALQIPDGSVVTSKLASGSVMGGNIGGNTITASNIAPGSITLDRLSGGDGVRPGTIILWNGSSCPNGYSQLLGYNGRFLRIASSTGGTGGSSTHTHTGTTNSGGNAHSHAVSITTGGNNGYVNIPRGTGANIDAAGSWHTHDVVGNTGQTTDSHTHGFTTSSGDNSPLWYDVRLCIKD